MRWKKGAQARYMEREVGRRGAIVCLVRALFLDGKQASIATVSGTKVVKDLGFDNNFVDVTSPGAIEIIKGLFERVIDEADASLINGLASITVAVVTVRVQPFSVAIEVASNYSHFALIGIAGMKVDRYDCGLCQCHDSDGEEMRESAEMHAWLSLSVGT